MQLCRLVVGKFWDVGDMKGVKHVRSDAQRDASQQHSRFAEMSVHSGLCVCERFSRLLGSWELCGWIVRLPDLCRRFQKRAGKEETSG